jgi:uroporphyrinogen-III synthase
MTSPVVRGSTTAEMRPLEGKRIILTRPRAQAGDFESRVRALGGDPVIAPAIAVVPPDGWTILDATLRRIGTYDWIAFTSSNAVRGLVERADAIGVDRDELRSKRLAAVGPATADLVNALLRSPDIVPPVHTAEALGQELIDVENARVLLPRGNLAGEALPVALRSRGAFVDEVVVYQTVAGGGVPTIVSQIRDSAVDAVLFASASAVQFVADALAASSGDSPGQPIARPLAACLGPITADAARAAGFSNVVVADETTQNDLIELVAHWCAASGSGLA